MHTEKITLDYFTQKPGYYVDSLQLLRWKDSPPSESELREYKETLDACQKCIENNPSNRSCRIRIAEVYKNLGIYQGVMDAYKDCLRFDPDDKICLIGLADAYFEARDYKKAIIVYNDCISNNPNSAYLHYQLAKSYRKLALRYPILANQTGYNDKAIEEFKIAIKNEADDKMTVDIYIGLASTYKDLGHYIEAIEAYKKAIKVDPDSDRAHFGLGEAYLAHGDRSNALEQYKILKGLSDLYSAILFDMIYE